MTEQMREQILREDLEAIYIGNLNTVEEDLLLPERGHGGSCFTWKSSETRFVEDDGTVHRPLSGQGNRELTLTVIASLEGRQAERSFPVTVLQEKKESRVAELRPVCVNAVSGQPVHLPSVVIARCSDGRQTTLPVTWEAIDADVTGVSRTEEGNTACPSGEESVSFGTGRSSGMKSVRFVRGTVEGTELPAEAEICFLPDGEKPVQGPQRQAEYFPLHQVRLLPGTPFYDCQRRMADYLREVDRDRLLYNFRRAAGLPTGEVLPLTGWEEESCKLRGHITGHTLSGLALAWAATGEEIFREKCGILVEGLAQCQEAFAASGQTHPGFLSAYSEEQFDLLEQYTRYPEIWAPYYTFDKILAGLLDGRELTGNEQALEIAAKMGDWVYARLSRLSAETRAAMWSMYIAGEFGGMQASMVRLYRLTGQEKHLQAARYFDNEKLFYPMRENCDTLEDMHANQHIPQILGAMEMYRTTGEEAYWRIGKNFREIVTGGHIYCIGGVGETEMFHRAGTTTSYLTDRAAESCASYNMLRLTGQLFPYTLDGALMDYYENTLGNHILTSASHAADGGTTYFLPLEPGGVKEYSTTENTCCRGTGLESRFRYMENIYAQDAEAVYVNLLIDSALTGETALTLRTTEQGEVTVRAEADMKKKLRVHVPSWAAEDFTAARNGIRRESAPLRHGYCEFEPLSHGEEICLTLPMKLRRLEVPSDPDYVNLAYGPWILAGLSADRSFRKAPVLSEIRKSGKTMEFLAGGMKMIPFHRVDREAYHVYFRR